MAVDSLAVMSTSDAKEVNGMGVVYLSILRNVPNSGRPSGLTNCDASFEASRLTCVQLCASTLTCQSVYTVLDVTQTGSRRWRCDRCPSIAALSDIPSGNGFYAYIKVLTKPVEPPLDIPNGILYRTDSGTGTPVAFYKCTTRVPVIKFGLEGMDDWGTARWPVVWGSCLDTLCDKAIMSASVHKVTFDDSGFIFSPRCQTGERTDGFSRCNFDGTWTTSSLTGVHCLSTTCYRSDVNERSFYIGTRSYTEYGRTCQHFSVDVPHPHTCHSPSLYPEDGFSVEAAQNYCRDPDTSKRPWCYTTDPNYRWEYCGIPQCWESH